MIETALHITLVALQMRFLVGSILCQGLVTVSHSVRLDVSLSHHIDSILVAQIIPEIIIRIMAGTHSIDVETLHDLNVLNHAFA